MGFGGTASETILFIGAVLVALSVSGILGMTSYSMASGVREKGVLLEDKLKTDFEIINDPDDIPVVGGDYIFYIKNTGSSNFFFTNTTVSVIVDGEMLTGSDIIISSSTGLIRRSEVDQISVSKALSGGYHTIRVILHNGKSKEMVFNV